MQIFLHEFAELLKKHDVEIEALEETVAWETYCDGIEFSMLAKWDEAGNQTRETCCIKTSKTPDPEELLSLANAASDLPLGGG